MRNVDDMGYIVSIDTGGTFTDGIIVGNGKGIVKLKVDTTPHDLTVCFMECIKKSSEKLGYEDISNFLENTDVIKWSSTIASNIVAEKKGPKIGLITSQDLKEDVLSSPIMQLLKKENVFFIKKPVNSEEILKVLKKLLENGVRRICIALNNSFYDSSDEETIKRIIEEQYPDHYLGYVPILLGSDICKHPDSMTRIHYSVLNSYVHGPMAASLFKAEDQLMSYGFDRPILIGHINGGVARIAKTKPVDTIESGPIFGIHASAYFAEIYNIQNAVTIDIGGTTTKIGYIKDGKPATNKEPEIFGIPIKIPLVDLQSIALGGGSVVKVKNGSLTIGPESQGAFPGPACYGLGGDKATLTDALLLAGYLDPEYFAGGARKLLVDESKLVFREISENLGLDLEETLHTVIEKAYNMVSEVIKPVIGEKALFAFGGNGGLFGCAVAEMIGSEKVLIFSLSSVFSAFGCAIADIMHSYEYVLSSNSDEMDEKVLRELYQEALRDMEGEGLDVSKVNVVLEIETEEGQILEVPYSQDFSKIKRSMDAKTFEIARLKAYYPSPKPILQKYEYEGEEPIKASKGFRDILWKGEWTRAKIYDWDLLKTGNVVEGPAILESADTTYLIPEGWNVRVDEYRNGVVEVIR